ncbi:MAG TPA: asparaginase [Nocardioides sp.]|uniref:asparaginase n=1 Tax=Nocardioides sp. TaxID=35761 RepID=UPI002E36F2FE|nr:asparaginase [Nocardioides sp.]HEX5090361.1 asparaginase [Nocardioides sp.]
MTTIEIHFLGGTIGYAGARDGEAVRLGGDALLAGVPGLDRLAVTLDVRAAAAPVPSASLTFDQLTRLAQEARWSCEAGTADAVVVVQGTDTLEESAYLLDLLWDRPEPVVLTGAMRNPTLAGADGPANLLAAVSVAADPAFRDLGALVVLADEVHSARWVRKVHTTRPHGFGSPDTGPLGVVIEGRPELLHRPASHRLTLRPTGPLTARVPVLTVGLDEDSAVVGALAAVADGLVVAALGGGHVPRPLAEPLGALAGELPVVLASRVGAGSILSSTYRSPGSETDLLGKGLLWSGFLGPAKARVLLIGALACSTDRVRLAETFAQASSMRMPA